MTITNTNILRNKIENMPFSQVSKVETLAKLYLESEPAAISDREIAELCDWLWSEFQTTPLNLEFSWYERYDNVAEMFTDIM